MLHPKKKSTGPSKTGTKALITDKIRHLAF